MREFLTQTLSRRMRPALGSFLTVVATLFCWGVLAAKNGAEQVDSGWAVATPVSAGLSDAEQRVILGRRSASQSPSAASTIASGAKHADPKQQILLHHVLQQTQTPLLQSRSSSKAAADANANQAADTSGQGSLRFAVRPDGIEGWRPAGQIGTPLNESWQFEMSAPQLNAPINATSRAGMVDVEGGPAGEEGAALKSSLGAESIDTAPGEATSNAAADRSVQQPIGTDLSLDDEDQAGPLSGDSSRESPNTRSAAPPLTKQLVALRSKVRGVLKGYYRRTLNSREHDPWEVMHGMLAYGVHSRIRQGGPRGEPVTSVGWLCYNKPCKDLTLMYVTPKGELRAKYGVGLQGHLGQLLAMLAQCRVSADYPIRVGNREFTIKDLIEAEKKTCYPKSELTFKLIALQYYLDMNVKWVNDQGLEWDIPRLIREELAQPIRGAACGGTHRLSSLSLTVKTRVRRGEPLDGEYARAAEFVKKYHQYAFRLQNRDGSLSTAWFRGRGDDSDINRRIKTTGHILEWLCYSLSDEELRDPQTVSAVTYLSNLMYSKYDNDWEVGPMCHAIHALLVYDERVFQPFDGAEYEVAYKPRPATAKRPQPSSTRR